ncbi:GTPase activating factor [Emydomyces testavorans]|uniref:GTPase activating factor n=1 Tax=Emydomyces testavorans TaxID=2070801 RepID=A0AAF0ILC2_9EURO|nr:GTPase activating factor [Emydomyces testavorans]
MESERRNGFKRNSDRQGYRARPIERLPSKKSSSKDRHGVVYPESFRDTTIRTVTPDSMSDPANNSPISDAEYITPNTASPHTTLRAKPRERRREFSPYYSTGDEEDLGLEPTSRRARSRTTTLDDQRSEISTNLLSRTRPRLGSTNAALTTSKGFEDPTVSIGYPSIIQSPTQRQRLSKAPSGGASLVANASRLSTYGSPLSNTDSSKILQLMKTTCGRMHGILSFRASGSTFWTSGYCAINVASGSLIYQAKGEPAAAKTLIPDLRGCRVRTLYDTEIHGSYLSVSTHCSALGVHLRPHVIETFDSWLAALLCWQPIRPKGVQNKMTKPQLVAIGNYRFPERRRNSESTIQKEAAIIKVGQMLLWDGQATSGISPSPAPKRISTFKQQRALSPSWRKVSCSLQENGYMKVFADTDASMIAFIQLSQLSRCAIQQLEPSVLQDEFCIAIYPQYSVHTGGDQLTLPIYLSLENRVLFEVWFVLLRAFTVPELYGPEQPLPNDDAARNHSLIMSNAIFTADMFRIERLLSIRIIEAKMSKLNKRTEDTPKTKKTTILQPSSMKSSASGDYYAEVLLDGEVRAKTAVKNDTSTPFWREDFIFYDLPPVLSNASVVVKALNAAQKDWTLVARGPYSLEDADSDPLTALGDVEITSYDAIYGRIDLRLEDLERGSGPEKWWPILNDRDQKVGEMLMRVQLDETVVLISQEYEAMSELLHSFSNGLTVNLAHLVPAELRQLSETFLDIFQVSGHAGEWIMALVEDEIDGIHRDSSASRLRYTSRSRIHSNDSYESTQEREALVRDLGRSATVEANLLFRGNSLLTKSLDMHMRRLGKEYLVETIGAGLRDIDESDPDCEIDPNRVNRQEDLERNWRNLILLTSNMWNSIAGSASRCPAELRHIFRHIRACAEDRYGDFLRSVAYSSVSGFLFLRFFCPAILNPKLFGLLKEHPRPRAQRTLTLVAKALQGLANLATFGNKEPWMEPMNKFLLSHRTEFKEFVDSVCSIPAERQAQNVNPSYATPIQILNRLPPTSREGFPSLPFLIDNARSFAFLVRLWLESAPPNLTSISDLDKTVVQFHTLCLQIQQRTKDCLNKAEQAERPSGNLEVKWEELVEQFEKSSTFYDESSSKANTPSVETAMSNSAAMSGINRNSIGYFSRPTFRHRNTDTSNASEDVDETRSNTTSGTWDTGRPIFTAPRYSEGRESVDNSYNFSSYSLDYPDQQKGRQSSFSKESSNKYRLFDMVTNPRRKAREKENQQFTPPDLGPRDEYI